MPKYAKVMVGFGVFLIACGLIGWAGAGFEAKAKSSMIAGGVSGALMIVMGLLSASSKRVPKMIGIHLGMVFPLIFAGVFAWRASIGWRAWAVGEPKLFVALLISVMAVASLVTLGMILRMRPRPEERGAASA